MVSRRAHILVTGGAGYLGSTLVPSLLAEGYEVTVLDNFLFRQNSLAHACYHESFHLIRGDIRSPETMREVLKGVDVVLPLAALVGAPLCEQDPVGAETTNLEAPLAMLKLLSPSQRVIMPTTNSGYGKGQGDGYCDERSPLNPLSSYAKQKARVEAALLERENAISFRLATVFGMSPRMRLDLLVNDFTYRAVNDGFLVLFEAEFRRNYLHVRDVTRAFLHAIDRFDSMRGQIYNVGMSDANLSKRELCATIREHVPGLVVLDSPFRKDKDQRDYLVSNAKIEATGFRPATSLHAGIRELVKGYQMIRSSPYANV
jgi:nucleoside-diphosphate-sugar epimerase